MSARFLNTTGKRIAFHREEMGISQEGLAVKLRDYGIDIKRSQVSRIENQDHPPSGEILSALAHILGLTTDYLLLLSDDPMPPEGAPHSFKEDNAEYRLDPMRHRLMQYWEQMSVRDQAFLLELAQRLSDPDAFAMLKNSVS